MPGLIGSFGGGSQSNTGGGPSPQDFQSVAFNQQQGKVAANQLGAQQGVGNSTGVVTALNANDLQAAQGLSALLLQQQEAQVAANANVSGANGLLQGLFGNQGGSFGNQQGGNQSTVV